jgi:hypothetical protein
MLQTVLNLNVSPKEECTRLPDFWMQIYTNAETKRLGNPQNARTGWLCTAAAQS